jgi:glutamyl/glutaminyl-tRNA synthetase
MSAEELRPLVARFFDAPWLVEGIDVVKTSVHKLTDFREALRFVTDYAPPEVDRAFAEKVRDEFRTNGTPRSADQYQAMVEHLKASTGLKGKALFQPLRLMVTGLDHGPELVRAIPLLQHAGDVDPNILSPLERVERCIR